MKEIADKVRRYCQREGIRVMAARVMTNRVCEDMVGCRITVPVRKVDDLLGTRFWPNEVSCWRWNKSLGATRASDGDGTDDDNTTDRGRERYRREVRRQLSSRSRSRHEPRSSSPGQYEQTARGRLQYARNYERRYVRIEDRADDRNYRLERDYDQCSADGYTDRRGF